MTFYDAISGKETVNFKAKIPFRLLAKLLKQWEKIIPYIIIANKLIDEQKKFFYCSWPLRTMWILAEDLVKVLTPAERETALFGGQNYVTVAFVLPIISSLVKHL